MKYLYKPACVAAILLLLAPLIYMAAAGVAGWDPAFFTEVISDARYGRLFTASLVTAAASALGAVVIGVPLAFLCARTNMPLGRFFEHVFISPLMIPSYFVAIAWIYVLGTNGLATEWFKAVLELEELPFALYGTQGVIAVMILTHFPIVTFMTAAGLRSLDTAPEKAALLTHSPLKTALKITLPRVMPFAAASALIVFIMTLNNFDIPSIFLADCYPMEIFYQFSVYYRPERAMMFAAPLVAASFLAVAGTQAFFAKRPMSLSLSAAPERAIIKLGFLGASAGFLFACLTAVLAVGVPLAGLMIQAGGISGFPSAVAEASKQIQNSLVASTASAALCVGAGLLLGRAIANSGPKAGALLTGLMLLPLAAPGTAIGVGLIRIFNQPWLSFIYDTPVISAIGHTGRFAGVAAIVLAAGFRSMDPSLAMSAKLAGISPFRRALKMTAPLMSRHIAAAFLVCFALSLNELAVSIMVNPPGFNTVSVRIFSLFHFNQVKQVAALCITMSAAAIAMYAAVRLIFAPKERPHGN